VPEEGFTARFSADRQKFRVAFPFIQAASACSPPPLIVVSFGEAPNPSTWV
jgi:hypothetical protein